jgi:hypothetical protein
MTSQSIFSRILPEIRHKNPFFLAEMADTPHKLPRAIRNCPVAMRYFHLLSPLDWSIFPERGLKPRGHHTSTWRYASFAAAHLVKLSQGIHSAGQLRQYLCDHPALSQLLGFAQPHSHFNPWHTHFQTRLPRKRHFNRVLHTLPNAALQHLLGSSVRLLQTECTPIFPDFGQAISLDTKLILAWVKENNPKAYVKERYNPARQPVGDPDCRLGVKRRRNIAPDAIPTVPTPTTTPQAGSKGISMPECYWGYASGVVATKVPGWGEFVLAEMTQPFNCADVSYFFPLMAVVEQRLGFRPRIGAFDAAFDGFYVYEYFYSPHHDGFAAVPLAKKGGYKERFFDANGLPLCQANLTMPLKFTYTDRTRLIIEHERGKYVCPLFFPNPTGTPCPVDHQRWPHGGCTADMPTATGARIRYQLDRNSAAYKEAYKQRTATERINSQAKALGIERPHLRHQCAITNQNTLIYILINLRGLHRVRRQKAARFP